MNKQGEGPWKLIIGAILAAVLILLAMNFAGDILAKFKSADDLSSCTNLANPLGENTKAYCEDNFEAITQVEPRAVLINTLKANGAWGCGKKFCFIVELKS